MSDKIYESVPETEDGDFEASNITTLTQRRKSQKPSLPVKLGIAMAITLFLTASIGLTATRRPTLKSLPQELIWSDCGDTPEEARRRNCHFDTLSFAWQTSSCYDHDNTKAFRTHNGSWTYYTAYRGTETRSEQDASTGEYETYVTAEYHFVHCTYMWRQLHRAYSLRGYIDDHVGGWNHTLHCQEVLLAGPGMRRSEVNTVGVIRYPRCRKVW